MRFLWACLLASGCAARLPATGVKVTAFNLYYRNAHVEKTFDGLARANADVVCLRELTAELATAFEARFAGAYPHRVLNPHGGWGAGIASRHPIVRSEAFEETPNPKPALEADIRIGGKVVRVVCVHYIPPFEKQADGDSTYVTYRKTRAVRWWQSKHLVDRYASFDGPLVLAGDFNDGPRAPAMELLFASGYADACKDTAGRCGNTWRPKLWLPAVKRIDHVVGRNVTFTRVEKTSGGGSDHHALSAWFDVP